MVRVYQGEYTVYQKDTMYCFLRGILEEGEMSLEDSLSGGGQYLFCPKPFQNQESQENFIANGISYLKRWNRQIVFMWIMNPEASFYQWKINKLEKNALNQTLFFDTYRLVLSPWESLTIEGEDFVFSLKQEDGYSFCSGKHRIQGSTVLLHLKTVGDSCGALCGSLFVEKEQNRNIMEMLDAGIRYYRVMEEHEENAPEQGFLASAVNRVLIPAGDLNIPFFISPHRLLEEGGTRFCLSGNQFTTNFTDYTGKIIMAEAEENAALVFQLKPVLVYQNRKKQFETRKRLYLGIQGDFTFTGENRKLLCGLSGTENILLNSDGGIHFQASMPSVYPYDEKNMGTTSWIGGIQGGTYYCQASEFAFYAADVEQKLRYLEIPVAVFNEQIPAVPMLPYKGLMVSDTEDILVLEDGLYQKRRAIFLEKLEKENNKFGAETVRAVTPQGIMAEITSQGNYNWVGFADFGTDGCGQEKVPDMCFNRIDENAKHIFQQKELWYVVDSVEKFEKWEPSEGFEFSIEGIRFSLLPDAWRNHADSRTMMLFQYSCKKCMKETLAKHDIFQQVMKKAYDPQGEVRQGYEELVEVVGEPGFQGLLAFNVTVSLKNLPQEIEFLMSGVDREKFYASYLIIRAGQVEQSSQEGLYLKPAKVSGLVDYETEQKLSYAQMPPDYDYLTTEIKIQIRESKLISFVSSSEVLINRIFEAKASARENEDGNCLILQGQLVKKDDISTYQYSLKQDVVYGLSGSGISDVWIQKLDLVTSRQGEGMFLMSGVLACHELEGADLLGFGGGQQEGLPFAQLVLRRKQETDLSYLYSMEYGLLQFDREAAVIRETAFPKRFALCLEGMIVEKTGETLEQKGYTSISAPIRQGVPGTAYQGFLWKISVGSMGEMSSQAAMTWRLVTAFWQGEDGKAEYYIGICLPKLFLEQNLKLQGIFKLGFSSVSLEKKEAEYILKLHNFHIDILGASFPEDSGDLYLFSDGENVGWYGAYEGKEE